MPNKYCNLTGTNRISDEYGDINKGFDGVQQDVEGLETKATAAQNHANNKNNPHSVTKSQVGLGNVDNYSTATQAQAQAGTATNAFMSPQRTKQAIDALAPAVAPVQSVAGKTGAVVITADDVQETTNKKVMTTAERTKLSGITAGAEPNQNAYSSINGIAATSKTDSVTIQGGTGIAVTQNPSTKQINITATGTSTPGAHASSHLTGGSDPIPVATTSQDGLMSKEYVAAINGWKIYNSPSELGISNSSNTQAIINAMPIKSELVFAVSNANATNIGVKSGTGGTLHVLKPDNTRVLAIYVATTGIEEVAEITGAGTFIDWKVISNEALAISNGANLNDYKTEGDYYTTSTAIAISVVSKPPDVASSFNLRVLPTANGWYLQILRTNAGSTYTRFYNGSSNTWTAWERKPHRVASQAEAESGTNNEVIMTPLRTRQATVANSEKWNSWTRLNALEELGLSTGASMQNILDTMPNLSILRLSISASNYVGLDVEFSQGTLWVEKNSGTRAAAKAVSVAGIVLEGVINAATTWQGWQRMSANDGTLQTNLNAERTNSIKIFNSLTTPVGAQNGDLWFPPPS